MPTDPDSARYADDAIDRDNAEEPMDETSRGSREPSLRPWARRPSVQRVLVRGVR